MSLRNCNIGGRGWRSVLVVLASSVLMLTLVTRFSAPINAQGPVVKSKDTRSVETRRQHLDQDASRLPEPVTSCTRFKPVVLYPLSAAAQVPSPANPFSLTLFTRPPPASFPLFS